MNKCNVFNEQLLKHYLSNEIELQHAFEQMLVELFGYSKISDEIVSQYKIQIGVNKDVRPDIIIRNADKKELFIIELKRLCLKFDQGYEDQLKSYMKQLFVNVGVLICDAIYLYYLENTEFISLKIPLYQEGLLGEKKFIDLFSKDSFDANKVQELIAEEKKVEFNIKKLKKDIEQLDVAKLIKDHFRKEYAEEEIETALQDYECSIKEKQKIQAFDNSYIITSSNHSNKTISEKDNTKYRFNGNTYGKGKLVLAVVQKYISDNPTISTMLLRTTFPNELQGGKLGVVQTIYDTKRLADNPNKRYFMNIPIKTSTDDCVVCSQWGIGNINKFIERAQKLGYHIETIESNY